MFIQKPCSIDGCDNPGVKRTWCEKHYQRWKHHGDPTFTQGPPTGPGHGNWRGGRTVTTSGYVMITLSKQDPLWDYGKKFGKYTRKMEEHRLVMAQHIGRPLVKGETVHHINGDKQDNRIENLQLRQGNHGRGVVRVCLDCGSHNVVAEEI